MIRWATMCALVLAGAAVLAASALGGQRAAARLDGTVGPDFTITLKQHGKAVRSLKAGTYTLAVVDKATIHGFSITGPHGFAKAVTPIPFTGTKTVTLKLKPGTYEYFCPSHQSVMFGRFKVT